ncbi:MAG TPA: bifunctional phosphoribosyl-AMP cyclohydrolase/phosphoribosyl-ATP diphosphatase HisIE [Pseudobacteroides sp.]|uniref:bifunctional phosphoribosyl-AMP cyclohydrolase/phosphoribosyl-ATP diphosphatase HisIE n=1 Tax=Pseudobacteroides sp. TaxID=1968840 RepID=UPI002F93963F
MDYLVTNLKFDSNGLIPVITQDCKTNEVLMLAYMNKEAYEKTVETKKVHYWSRSRSKLWLKGETSGHYQYVKSICIDCDNDTLLIKVEQVDAACHTGHYTCFYRDMNEDGSIKENSDAENNTVDKAAILQEVYNVIADRRVNPKEGSYTNYLFDKGIDKILKKVGEETAEVIIASKNKAAGEIRYEIADLIYHLFVLMVERDVKLEDIYDELKGRR